MTALTNIFSFKTICLHLGIVATMLPAACRVGEKFPELGDKVSSPTDVAVSDDGKHFFVLNADFDRSYDQGSILTLDSDGNKVGALAMPRLGRNLTVAGNDMIATFDRADDKDRRKVVLLDISNPAAPQVKRTWEVDCAPWNAVLRKGYKYFSVACMNGQIFVGTLADNREESQLKLVRRYTHGGRDSWVRRAMHIDPKRQLLFIFTAVTKLQNSQINDLEDDDVRAFDEETNGPIDIAGGNEVPDSLESSAAVYKRAFSSRQIWQYVVYNIAAEAAVPTTDCGLAVEECGPFPYRELDTSPTAKDPTTRNELRWLYFTLSNIDGYPDSGAGIWDPNRRVYRTNIWDAKPDPTDEDAFYISQRGGAKSPFANSIIRVSITGDIAATDPVARTADVLSFERVYGYKGELNDKGFHYPSDFEVQVINGAPSLLVNHFKDLSGFKRGETYFSVVGKVLDEGFLATGSELIGPDANNSFYQIAVNSQGRALTGAFYGNAVILLDFTPGVGIKQIQRIE